MLSHPFLAPPFRYVSQKPKEGSIPLTDLEPLLGNSLSKGLTFLPIFLGKTGGSLPRGITGFFPRQNFYLFGIKAVPPGILVPQSFSLVKHTWAWKNIFLRYNRSIWGKFKAFKGLESTSPLGTHLGFKGGFTGINRGKLPRFFWRIKPFRGPPEYWHKG